MKIDGGCWPRAQRGKIGFNLSLPSTRVPRCSAAGVGCLGDGGGIRPLAFLRDSDRAVGEMNGGELCVRCSEVGSV